MKCEGCDNPIRLCNGTFPHDAHDFVKVWVNESREETYHCPGSEFEGPSVSKAGDGT